MTLEQLQTERAALPEPAVDLRLKAHILDARITAARNETSTLAELDPKIADLTTWRDHLIAWRETLCAALLGCPQRPRTDHDAGVLQNLKLSIMTVDRGRGVFDGSGYALETLRLGALIREAGYVEAPPVEGQAVGRLPWFGSLPEVEQRLHDLQKRRDEAQARLDATLRDE